jgi:hypothetical protein
MLNWRYQLELTSKDVTFSLSSDFSHTPIGADWMELATTWYESGLIPRSIWINMLKQNDMLPSDYDDETGREEITADETIINANTAGNEDYANSLEQP